MVGARYTLHIVDCSACLRGNKRLLSLALGLFKNLSIGPTLLAGPLCRSTRRRS